MTDTLHMAQFLTSGWRHCAFEHFRDGVEICRILRGEPELALLRYAPGASVPKHRHTGLETILVLEGSQSDEYGHYGPGSLVANPEGSIHSVSSEEGCVVLIQWTKPVEIL
ncbi:anti-sigma factor ChrR (cupin superfamily) [Rhizobium sp. SG_E_25_P2]|jgi:anti-sigma factor ChrR (cupin superfamily)|uniref:cupin domain-containing protein n=1 Tax=Rhizobium sp. SG_E_25_P2 TaxID=2879942 RepID=UPI002476B725|nr:cupin domain-containing protein [Rhizobium sp. SG_E_25_P2]MDH6269710.1 anti-sigma factor ChrR (cupin superfamily) [Rhizobium sp. SG_E_25_P2]